MRRLTRRKIIVVAGVIAALSVIILCFTLVKKERNGTQYEFAEVTRGDLENVVTATGTLSAVGTVDVGTQVSGTLARTLVDFNDKVRKGQILAVLDTTLLHAAVMDMQAGLMSAQAQYEQALAEYQRDLPLSEKGYLTEEEFLPVRVTVQIREAGVKSARAALDRAEANLRYAVIRSPIDGTVIQRNIERGQTVAASLSAPTLFVVAENLSDMEILVNVDETDISQVKEGQSTRFSVQAYPDKKFEGRVRQIRLQPQTVQNVVNYTVVVAAPNEEGLLLPGMTATVDFIIDQRKGVLLVPNATLRLVPTKEMIAQVGHESDKEGMPAGTLGSRGGRSAGMAGRRGAGGQPGITGEVSMAGSSGFKPIWYLDADGRMRRESVETGMTDGRMTELVSGSEIREGMKVISGMQQSAGTTNQERSQPGGPRFRLF